MTKAIEIQTSGATTALEAAFRSAPGVTAFYVRRAVGDMVGDLWKAMRAKHAGTPMAEFNKRAIKYFVAPRGRSGRRVTDEKPQMSAAEVAQARAMSGQLRLDDIVGRVRSWSDIALMHETGGVVRAKGGKPMLVPTALGRQERDALGLDRNRRKKSKKAFTPQGLEDRGYTLYPSKDQRRVMARSIDGRVIPVWTLTSSVRMKPRLGLMATWADLNAKRDQRMQRAVDSIAKQLALGITEVARRAKK